MHTRKLRPNLVHGEKWHGLAGVAAHSAFGFDADMSDPFLRSGLAAQVLGHRLKPENWHVTCRRVEDASGVWLETSHLQFAASHGVRYNRRLLSTRPADLRGEYTHAGVKQKQIHRRTVPFALSPAPAGFSHPASRRF